MSYATECCVVSISINPFTSDQHSLNIRITISKLVVSVASDSTGFFCRVGPMTIFVSQHAMSEDLCFDSANGEG